MYEFLILGLIPGTTIELTFGLWLKVVSLLLALVVIRRMHRSHLVRNGLVTLSVVRATHRPAAIGAITLA